MAALDTFGWRANLAGENIEAKGGIRSLQKQDTRRKLLAMGRMLLLKNGVEAVSMEDIAQAVGVSRATAYLHFPGRQALLAALLEADWESQMRLFGQLRPEDFDNREKIRKWVIRVAQGMVSARDSFAIHRAAMGADPQLTLGHFNHRRKLGALLLEVVGTIRAATKLGARDAIVAELLIAELEYFASAAALGWTDEEVALGSDLIAGRLAEFAQAQP